MQAIDIHQVSRPVATRICIVRHGETGWNVERRIQRHTDIPLNATRRAQALAMAFNAAHHRFSAISSCDLARATETAGVLAQREDLEVNCLPQLRERHYGALQGLDKREIFSAWGEEASRRWWRGYFEPPPPLDRDDLRHPRFDLLYAGMNPDDLPASESLRDCQRRMLPYRNEVLLPRLRAGCR